MSKPPAHAGAPNVQAMMRQAQKLQAQLQQVQAELADVRVEGSAGGGLVGAAVSGSGELLALTIDPQAVDPDDTETLADLVLAAVRDASRAAQALQEARMGPLTQGLGMAPGLGL